MSGRHGCLFGTFPGTFPGKLVREVTGQVAQPFGHRKPPEPRTLTRRAARCRRLSYPSPRTPRANRAYVPARTQTRAAPNSELCHVRLPCAGAPWLSRATRTSCSPLALPEPAARPLTPRRVRRSEPHCQSAPFVGACTLLQAPCRTRARRARHDAAPPREAAAAHAPRHPNRSAAQPASRLCSRPAKHSCTPAPPTHWAADFTSREFRSTRRGARGDGRPSCR